MKLHCAPGARSFTSRISLHGAGLAAGVESVDLETKIPERGQALAE